MHIIIMSKNAGYIKNHCLYLFLGIWLVIDELGNWVRTAFYFCFQACLLCYSPWPVEHWQKKHPEPVSNSSLTVRHKQTIADFQTIAPAGNFNQMTCNIIAPDECRLRPSAFPRHRWVELSITHDLLPEDTIIQSEANSLSPPKHIGHLYPVSHGDFIGTRKRRVQLTCICVCW